MKKYVLICAIGLIANPAIAENVNPIKLKIGIKEVNVPTSILRDSFTAKAKELKNQ